MSLLDLPSIFHAGTEKIFLVTGSTVLHEKPVLSLTGGHGRRYSASLGSKPTWYCTSTDFSGTTKLKPPGTLAAKSYSTRTQRAVAISRDF